MFWRFIYALGILHVGEQTARDLANHFEILNKFLNAKLEDIESIENIGPVVAKSIFEFLNEKQNKIFIEKLIANGVKIEKSQINKEGVFFGKVFVLTGTLPTLSRDDAKKKIIENGGKVSGSVSTKTDFVLAGDNAGSKYNEAKKLGVQILTEDEFLKML